LLFLGACVRRENAWRRLLLLGLFRFFLTHVFCSMEHFATTDSGFGARMSSHWTTPR
jgi:hypothetical protein